MVHSYAGGYCRCTTQMKGSTLEVIINKATMYELLSTVNNDNSNKIPN